MSNHSPGTDTLHYDDDIVKKFIIAALLFAGIAFLVGVIVALQMAFWQFNFDTSWLTFGRLRPLHTNAAIFAFAGNIVFAGVYHSTQRLLKTPLFSRALSLIHFWGWQAIILAAAITLPLGFTTGKEYAELEWPIDIAITLIWVVFAINFFGTLAIRKVQHMYVAIWFYIATIVTVAVLHIVNSLALPVSMLKSYPVFAGIQDAMVQWWYGHNAVAFFLTTPFLGLMYYYLPKAVKRPVYSYRLSIIHFWALVFMYIWAGPHHLLNTALPDWAQTLGMVFSVALWAPSWGGMINGLLTLRGAWDKLRTDPVVKFFVAAVTCYGMSTFEGPLLSIKSVSSLGHYTDWIVGHVHVGTLGWNSFMAFGIAYFLLPKIWKTELYSKSLATAHFWIGTVGIVLYYISMLSAGITQGLMWRNLDEAGKMVYPNFVQTVTQIIPLYQVRAFAGLLFLTGFIIMAYNLIKTAGTAAADAKPEAVPVDASFKGLPGVEGEKGHRKLEGLVTAFTVLTVIAILIGSVLEILPTLNLDKYVKPADRVNPFTPLEIAGRDVYIKEGCYTCHSQMIRKMPSDVVRFGAPSTIGESMYNHPFQWGSKRTGPDLARVGKKYPHLWHWEHMINPRSMIKESVMPNYPWLRDTKVDFYGLRKRISVLSTLGVPYSDDEVSRADILAEEQAKQIATELRAQSSEVPEGIYNKELIALIAYLQALGQKGK